ncbi:unnamed protein product, partial [Polarella glacialis]
MATCCFGRMILGLMVVLCTARTSPTQPEDEEYAALNYEMIRYEESWFVFTKACPGSLLVHLKSPRIRVSQTLRLEIEISNICEECSHEIPAGSRVTVADYTTDGERPYFVVASIPLKEKMRCATSQVVTLELRPRAACSTFSCLPAKLALRVLDPNG